MKLLVGYGNTLRGDDGVGCQLASQLAQEVESSGAVQVICAQQLLPEVAAAIADAERVIFVDASVEGLAGSVHVQSIAPAEVLSADAHALLPPDLLRLADVLYGRCPPAYLVTITGETFDLSDTLSEMVQSALPKADQAIRRLLEQPSVRAAYGNR